MRIRPVLDAQALITTKEPCTGLLHHVAQEQYTARASARHRSFIVMAVCLNYNPWGSTSAGHDLKLALLLRLWLCALAGVQRSCIWQGRGIGALPGAGGLVWRRGQRT